MVDRPYTLPLLPKKLEKSFLKLDHFLGTLGKKLVPTPPKKSHQKSVFKMAQNGLKWILTGL